MFFVLLTVPIISFFVVTCGFLSAAGGREVLFSFRQSAYISFIIKAFIVFFYYYHPLTAYIGYLHLPARASIRVVFFHNFISVFLFVKLLPLFSAGYQSDLAKERRPLNSNHGNCWREPYVLDLRDSGQVTCGPPLPSRLVRLSFRAPLSQLLGYA